MVYRINPKNGDKISQISLGCMRLPKKGNQIDQQKTNQMIKYAIKKGINYFDTAYIYPGSEEALGKALAYTGARKRVYIATKLPIFLCKKPEDFDKIFNKELERLGTDYIDYYFMHMLCDIQTWERLKSIGIEAWIAKKKKSGKIRNLGFSYHGGRLEFKKVLEAFDWDFAMIQYNYLDENNQAGKSGLETAHEKGLPVFIMEPLRGGMLANAVPDAAKQIFKRADKEKSLAEWALRWVWNHKEVTSVLSGMSTLEQLKENITLADTAQPNHLTEADHKVYKNVVAAINSVIKVPCTGCGYCLPCPKGVDIPTCFSVYNETFSGKYLSKLIVYHQLTGGFSAKQTDASKCVACGKCEKHCPQSIKISKELANVSRRTKSSIINPIFRIIRKVMKIT